MDNMMIAIPMDIINFVEDGVEEVGAEGGVLLPLFELGKDCFVGMGIDAIPHALFKFC
jgi:hypothetical protein